MKIVLRFAFLLVLCCLVTPSHAQYSVADPTTVERHRFNLDVAYISGQSRGGEQQALPGVGLIYGYSNNLHLAVGLGYSSVRPTGKGRFGGFGDVTTGVKWRFQEETKHRPQFALGYQIKFPTADADRGLGSGNVDNAILLTGGKSFGRWFTYGNAGYSFLGGRSSRNYVFLGAGLTYQLTEHLVAGAQVFGNSAGVSGARDELAWGVNLNYNFAPDRTLKLGAGKSERGYSDLNVYAGLTFVFGK